MNNSQKNCIKSLAFLTFLVVSGLYLLFHTPEKYSEGERRLLSQRPKISGQSLYSAKYMNEFEQYALDQFPFRESMRRVKAISELYIFQKYDTNKYYLNEGQLSKIEYPLNENMLKNASAHFRNIYDMYLVDKHIIPYFVIIPDKNYYLASKSGRISMNYDKLYQIMRNETSFMDYIEIKDKLDISNYYTSDTHWRQETILNVADLIADSMGSDIKANYIKMNLDYPFYGVYAGQSALPIRPDKIKYMTNDILKKCVVTVYTVGKPQIKEVYDMDKSVSKDPYEMFLSGANPLITIENPNTKSKKELIIFRDSFGSSIAPLFIQGYSKITLIDIRYIQSDQIGSYVTFENQDVLFLYSTLLLNNSAGLK